MPLQQARVQKTDETKPSTGTTPAAPTTPLALDASRYDTASVNRILTLADQMQAQHRQSMSPQDIEVLGQELGIEPAYIRRAVTEVQADLHAKAVHASARAAKRAARRRTWATVTEPLRAPFWCFLAMSIVLPWMFTPRPTTNTFYYLLPLLLAFAMGIKVKGYKDIGDRQIVLGVWQGFWLGAAGIAAFFVNVAVHHMDLPDIIEFLLVLTAWLGGGTVAGLMGTATRNCFDNFIDTRIARQTHERDT